MSQPLIPLLAAVLSLAVVAQVRSGTDASVFEHTFLHEMIDHHRAGQKMAELCLQNARSVELKTECASMKELQARETEQLSQWSEQWYSTQISEHRNIMNEKPIKRLRKLRGEAFDREFLVQAENYLTDEGKMAADCRQRSRHAELLQFCSNLEQKQQSRREKLKKWQRQWFTSSEALNRKTR